MSDYTRQDIEDALRDVGLQAGDLVFTHSNLGFFGRLEGADSSEELADAFLDAFLDVLGPDGTFVVPTFTYSFCEGERFDPEQTESVCGLLSKHVRTDDRSIRSHDPNFSVAAIGPLAEELTSNPPDHSFGPDCFWERFLERDGVFCNLNFDAGATFVHYVEREVGVPYRWDKEFPGILETREGERKAMSYHYVWDHDVPDHEPNFASLTDYAEEKGIVNRTPLGRGEVLSVDADALRAAIQDGLEEDPSLLIQGSIQT